MKKNKFIFIILILLTPIISFSSCSGGGAAIVDVQTHDYKSPDFASYTFNRIAVFPVKNKYLTPKESNEIERYFQYMYGPRQNMIWQDSIKIKMSNDSLFDIYYDNLEAYKIQSGIQDTGLIIQIGELLGCDLIIQGLLLDIKQIDGKLMSHTGSTKCTVIYSAFSTLNGKLISESSCKVNCLTASGTEPAPPLIDAVKEGIYELLMMGQKGK